ncbi:MAG: hypothetical protein KJ941_07050 [Bacteroidetes bacterium]|nr:hypothetical protein [Bacteroidota bacterium]
MNIVFLVVSHNFYGQKIEVRWSQPFEFNNKEFGTPEAIIGVNHSQVYAICRPTGISKKLYPQYILALQKDSLKEKSKLALRGESTFREIALEDKRFLKSFITAENVFLFWTDANPVLQNVYAEVFDTLLNQTQLLTKILDATSFLDYKNENQRISGIQVLFNSELDNELVSVIEMYNDDTGELSFGYTLSNEKLIPLVEACFPLPLKITSENTHYQTHAEYKYKEDGRLYIKVNAERFVAENNTISTHLFWANTLTDELSSETLDDGLRMHAWDVLVRKNTTILTGIIQEKHEEENLIGIYFNEFDTSKEELKRAILSPFNVEQMELFQEVGVENTAVIEMNTCGDDLIFFFNEKNIKEKRKEKEFKTNYKNICQLVISREGEIKNLSTHFRVKSYKGDNISDAVSIVYDKDRQIVWCADNNGNANKPNGSTVSALKSKNKLELNLPVFRPNGKKPKFKTVKLKQELNEKELLDYQLDGTIAVDREVYGFQTYKKRSWSSQSYGRFMVYKVI